MYWQKSRFLAILLIYACKGDCLGVSILFYSYPDGRGADPTAPWVPGAPRFFAVIELPAAVIKEKGLFDSFSLKIQHFSGV